MKKLKKILALVIAMVIVVAMAMPSFAAEPGEPAEPAEPAVSGAPTSGSITVNSPVVGATYNVYKIFDMTTNEAVNAFSYTISEESPFYTTVSAYAADTGDGDEPIHGITLTPISGSDPATYNVSVDETVFDAQDFGQAMQAALEVVDITADASATATVATSDQLKFEGLALGYYLINPTYPAASYGTVTMGSGADAVEFTVDDLEKDGDELADPLELTEAALAKIDDYVESQIGASWDSAEFADYLADKGITTNPDGTPLDDAGKQGYYNELRTEMTDDAEAKILAAFANQFAGSEADINVKEPILVFLDSSQPDAVINEKNELDKWDVPVNPEGDVEPGTPDHGEPDGGKNIIVQEDPAYYADWSEAEIGESVHYQLRVNAMNFIRTGATDDTIKQVKEYFLADYQSGHMEFDESKGLHVSIYAGNDNNDSQTGMTNVTKNPDGSTPGDGYLDYTDQADIFFKNTTNQDADPAPTDIFGSGTGIMVPWVIVSDANAELDPDFPIYTTTKVPTGEYQLATDDEIQAGAPTVTEGGKIYILDRDNQKIPLYDTYYVYSLYNSDVTIVVDYWMILKDDAVVDDPGNNNYAQYGWSPVDNKDPETGEPQQPTPPDEEDKPSEKEDVDKATVYTFALAWVKVDEKGKELADAEFTLPFYVKTTKDNDGAYVYAFETLPQTFAEGDSADNYTNIVTTTADSAVITIKGVEQGTYSITESKAPDGYNQLAGPFDVEAKKSGDSVTTTTTTTIKLDAQGNVTDETAVTTVTYNTDPDSNVANVPVYQFPYIENQQGTELPSTGGIGTTIFYVVGAILVIGAGVILITRRRMDA